MIRIFEFRDLDRIMEIWLEGNLSVHPFIEEAYWRQNFEAVKSILSNAEVYVYEEGGQILGFIGLDAEYILGIFVAKAYQKQGIGQMLMAKSKRKKRLSLHVYEKNVDAVAFCQAQGFHMESSITEKETGEHEYLMVFSEKREPLK